MILEPRYEGAPVLSVDGHPSDQLRPLTRQRRRLQSTLAALDDEQWLVASRCDNWTVRDVVAHLAGVNRFWRASVRAGLAGTPTRFLVGFDPATTPPLMVDQMSSMTSTEVLDAFVASNDAFLDVVAGLTDEEWTAIAESPAGHVPIHLLAQHALWDSWIHERDIAIPLGIDTAVEPDELRSCLQYAAALSPAIAIGLAQSSSGVFAIEATDPDIRFTLDVADCVVIRDGVARPDVPTLRGDAVCLIEALSLRRPMPDSSPLEWLRLIAGLATAFDADPHGRDITPPAAHIAPKQA